MDDRTAEQWNRWAQGIVRGELKQVNSSIVETLGRMWMEIEEKQAAEIKSLRAELARRDTIEAWIKGEMERIRAEMREGLADLRRETDELLVKHGLPAIEGEPRRVN